jgi:hypothetical protein
MKPHCLLIRLVILAVLLSACTTATLAPTPTPPPVSGPATVPTQPSASPVVLKLEGSGGTKTLTMDDLKALPATEGWAGIKNSTGKITVPARYKGVTADELCKLVGGIGPDTGVNLTAKDGYAMTISYDQITQGDFITYDPGTGDEIKAHDPLTVVIAYEKEGQPLPEDTEGPLKLVVVSAKNNQVVDGHWASGRRDCGRHGSWNVPVLCVAFVPWQNLDRRQSAGLERRSVVAVGRASGR